MTADLQRFSEVWLVDFEFQAPSGERPAPVCLVGRELKSGREIRLWKDELSTMSEPPYAVGSDSLFVAYSAPAELTCHLALGWPMPENVLDLYVEFRNLTNGRELPHGPGLLGALAYFGLPCLDAAEKESMRQLAMRGGDYTEAEKQALLDYCATDVVALERLLPVMLPHIDLPRALLRGRYQRAVADIEHNGIPVDVGMIDRFRGNWEEFQSRLIREVDADFGVYEGKTFKTARFERYLGSMGMSWPYLPSGHLKLDDDTFKDMSLVYPEIGPLRELRKTLGRTRQIKLEIGADGRNRTGIRPFSSKTGRNQPSTTKYVFGLSSWQRGWIKPEPGMGLAYIDFSQQEFGIAAALSGDEVMKEAYASGDPYLAFAKQAGAVPTDATKASHRTERDQFKACVLAVQYGMGEVSLAERINQPVARARELLTLHKGTYRRYWQWSEGALNYASLKGKLYTVFGWELNTGRDANYRSIANFPMQANGAEMLRVACILMHDRGVKVCAPIHDAILIEARLEELDAAIARAQEAMSDASEAVLGDFRLNTDVEKVVRYPERYMDERGAEMWERAVKILNELGPS